MKKFTFRFVYDTANKVYFIQRKFFLIGWCYLTYSETWYDMSWWMEKYRNDNSWDCDSLDEAGIALIKLENKVEALNEQIKTRNNLLKEVLKRKYRTIPDFVCLIEYPKINITPYDEKPNET